MTTGETRDAELKKEIAEIEARLNTGELNAKLVEYTRLDSPHRHPSRQNV